MLRDRGLKLSKIKSFKLNIKEKFKISESQKYPSSKIATLNPPKNAFTLSTITTVYHA